MQAFSSHMSRMNQQTQVLAPGADDNPLLEEWGDPFGVPAFDRLALSAEQRRVLERYYLKFVRAGAALDAGAKARLADINARLATLGTTFSQNVLADEQSYTLVLDGEDDLAGLPDFVRAAARAAAEQRGLAGKHVITISRSSVEPFLQFSARRDLGEKVFRAWIARGAGGGT